MNAKERLNSFVEKHGTGYRTPTGEEKRDRKTETELWTIFYEKTVMDELFRVIKKMKEDWKPDILADILERFKEDEYYKVVEYCITKYDPARKKKKAFFNLFCYKAGNKLNDLNEKIKVKNKNEVPLLVQGADDEEFERDIPDQKNELPGEAIVKNGALLDFLNQILRIIKGTKRAHFFMNQLFYTELFLTICCGDVAFDISEYQHKRDIEDGLDKDFIEFIYRDHPKDYHEYKSFLTKSPKEIDQYYDGETAETALREMYATILTDEFRGGKRYLESVPIPIKPNTIFTAYLFVHDNKDRSNGEIVRPRSAAYISKYKKSFDEKKEAFQIGLVEALS